jgi:hypothetical protein
MLLLLLLLLLLHLLSPNSQQARGLRCLCCTSGARLADSMAPDAVVVAWGVGERAPFYEGGAWSVTSQAR